MGKYQPFNDLPAAQFSALVDDISKRGVLLPILVDENGKTIDGHQRRRAAAEAGVECPQVVVEGLSEDDKETLALVLNLYRRHLSGVERSKAIQQLVNLGMSTRQMGDVLGLSKSTVHREVEQLSQMGQLTERPERVESSDGKSRPATMPKRPPGNVDPETGEVRKVAAGTSDREDEDAQPSVTTPAALNATTDGGEGGRGPAPALPPTVGGVEGYRASATKARSTVRSHLLTLDPERVITTADEPEHWRQFSADVRGWLDELDGHLSGPALKAVR